MEAETKTEAPTLDELIKALTEIEEQRTTPKRIKEMCGFAASMLTEFNITKPIGYDELQGLYSELQASLSARVNDQLATLYDTAPSVVAELKTAHELTKEKQVELFERVRTAVVAYWYREVQTARDETKKHLLDQMRSLSMRGRTAYDILKVLSK